MSTFQSAFPGERGETPITLKFLGNLWEADLCLYRVTGWVVDLLLPPPHPHAFMHTRYLSLTTISEKGGVLSMALRPPLMQFGRGFRARLRHQLLSSPPEGQAMLPLCRYCRLL